MTGNVPVTSVAPPARFIAEVERTPPAELCTIPAVDKPDNVRPVNVGEAAVLIFCIVLTAPLATLKLVELNEAIPLATVDALSIVTVDPPLVALARVSAPARPFRLVTPLAEQVTTTFDPSTHRIDPLPAPRPESVRELENVQPEEIVWTWLSRVMRELG